MTTPDQSIEQEIQAKGKTAPRVTPADIEAEIVSEHYFTAADGARMSPHGNHPIHNLSAGSLGLITICVLITRNGTKLVGVNEGPVSVQNFDADMGRRMAREKAVNQLWPMLGYELRTKLADS